MVVLKILYKFNLSSLNHHQHPSSGFSVLEHFYLAPDTGTGPLLVSWLRFCSATCCSLVLSP